MTAIPFDMRQARRAERIASRQQRNAEQTLASAGGELARAEAAYREALTSKMEELHGAGVAWTACRDLALGHEPVRLSRERRDVAKIAVEVATHAVYRAGADRRAVAAFNEWSYRREIAEGYGTGPVPAFSAAFGAAA